MRPKVLSLLLEDRGWLWKVGGLYSALNFVAFRPPASAPFPGYLHPAQFSLLPLIGQWGHCGMVRDETLERRTTVVSPPSC